MTAQTLTDLNDRLSACSTRIDLMRAVTQAYREFFGLGSVRLYLSDTLGRLSVPPGPAAPDGQLSLSPGLATYFLDGNRIWDPANGEYLPDKAETEFLRVSGARLVIPLVCSGRVEGLALIGPDAANLTCEDYAFMKIIARQSALQLGNLRLQEELTETRAFASVARVSTFVVHDLKNLTQKLSLLIDNAGEHLDNPEFQRDMMAIVRQTVGNMKSLIQKLKKSPGSRASRRPSDIQALSRTVIDEFAKTRSRAVIALQGTRVQCQADPEELQKVIVNLIQNGIDATNGEGTVRVETGLRDAFGYVKVTDNGCGMTQKFMQQELFKPFRSTKMTGLGLGLYQCRQIVESLGGNISVLSETGAGSSFMVLLPVAGQDVSFVA